MVYGTNDHHKCEALFKAMAHALKQAIKLTKTGNPFDKGCSLEIYNDKG